MKAKLNVALLRKIKKTILAQPKRLDMHVWTRSLPKYLGGPTCGTVGCIAGWACLLSEKSGKSFAEKEASLSMSIQDYSVSGCQLLGLTRQQGVRLFFVGNWPDKWQRHYQESIADKGTAVQIVAARIDAFIKSKGKE